MNLIFLIGCIGTRLFLVYIAWFLIQKPAIYLKIMGLLFFISAMSLIIIFLNDWRKTGIETNNKPIWWNKLRPIHALFFILFSYSVMFKETRKHAWKFLLADTLIGLGAHLRHHSN